jgi:hypothetical protein
MSVTLGLSFLLVVHDQRDMFEEPLQVLEGFQRADEFLEVVQPARRLGRLVVLPHGGVAALVEDDLGQFDMRQGFMT